MSFYIGEEIICVNSKRTYVLVEGKEYKVLGVRHCSCEMIEISVVRNNGHWGFTVCTACKVKRKVTDLLFHRANRFAPKQWLEESEKAVEQLLKGDKIEM